MFALFFASLLSFATLSAAACCANPLTYGVSTPGTLNYLFSSNYLADAGSNGVNASIAVVAGCNVTFNLNATALSYPHPFHIKWANGTDVDSFNQGQTSGSQVWNVPANAASYQYIFRCGVHGIMTNIIRVLASCDMDTPPTCAAYCANINSVCQGSNAQFPTPDSYSLCANSCPSYPNVPTLLTSGDSAQCRNYHLALANQSASNAVIHCPHAAFNGGPGVCGSYCNAYCDTIATACTGNNQVFASYAKCLQECAYYPVDPTFNLTANSLAAGNSVNCRAWHSQVAVTATGSGITLHCGHASPQGGQQCGSDCENYCNNAQTVCNSNNGLIQWADLATCLAACRTFPGQNMTNSTFTNNPINSGNSLPCRKWHASVAGTSDANAQVHCKHTGPLGGSGVCGSECEGVCNLVVGACGSSVSASDCMTKCAALGSTATYNTSQIFAGSVPKNSTGCAVYYALKALSDPSLCNVVGNSLVAATGNCLDNAAATIKVSWGIVAVILLALGFM